MSAFLFYMSRNQHAYDRLALEIRTAFASLNDIRLGCQLNSCVYLDACIKETLRFTPSIGSAPWREVGPGGEIVDNIHVPEGCSIGTGIYSIHHNPDYFPDHARFIPERWLAKRASGIEAQSYTTSSAFAPFSLGPRSCVGQRYAEAEMRLALATLIWQFDFQDAASDRQCYGSIFSASSVKGVLAKSLASGESLVRLGGELGKGGCRPPSLI